MRRWPDAGNEAGVGVTLGPKHMNAHINKLVYELGGLRLAQGRPGTRPEVAARIAAIEAELERAHYQFHCVSVRA